MEGVLANNPGAMEDATLIAPASLRLVPVLHIEKTVEKHAPYKCLK